MLFKSRRNEYVDTEGPVRYLDGSGLNRPLNMPRTQIAVMAAFVVAAALIGGYLLHTVLDAVHGSAARAQASVEENLARAVSYDLPNLASFMPLGDEEIVQALADAGYSVIDRTNAEEKPNGGLELVKLPSDVSEAEALLLYANGVDKLSAGDAALLLNGSWTLDVDRDDPLEMRVRYADFTSGGLEAALDSAMATEGLDPATVAEDGTGVDEVGNTYRTGTVDVDGAVYTWKVSAIPLSDMYDIAGLPEDAVYVGIRLSA